MWKRILLLVLLVASAVVAWANGLHEKIEIETLREIVDRAGYWGPVVFIVLFGLEGIGVPGVVFMVTAIALWPPPLAFLFNWLGAQMAGLVGFSYARWVGRDWIAERLPERVRRFEARVAERGVLAVVLIRVFFFLAPPAHWALGLSPVSFRAYLVGSAIGFVPGMLVVSYAGGPALRWFAEQPGELWMGLGAAFLVGTGIWWLLQRRSAPADDR